MAFFRSVPKDFLWLSCGYIWSPKHFYAVRSVKACMCQFISDRPLLATAYGTLETVLHRNTDSDTFSIVPIDIPVWKAYAPWTQMSPKRCCTDLSPASAAPLHNTCATFQVSSWAYLEQSGMCPCEKYPLMSRGSSYTAPTWEGNRAPAHNHLLSHASVRTVLVQQLLVHSFHVLI